MGIPTHVFEDKYFYIESSSDDFRWMVHFNEAINNIDTTTKM